MKALMIGLVIGLGSTCFAVNPSEIPEYTHQGSLVTLRIVPKDRTAKIFVVGRKAAELDLKNEAQILSVNLLDKKRTETLRMNNQGEYYEVVGLPGEGKPYQLMIEAAVRGKTEELKVNIPMRKK